VSESASGFRFPLGSLGGWRSRPAPSPTPTWDDVPDGRVPDEVIRYFERAVAREEERAARRALAVGDAPPL